MSEISTSENSKSEYHQTERKKSNLAFAFFCLDKSRATDMEIFYAFCRLMDDIADEECNDIQTRKTMLENWRKEIKSIYDESGKLSPLGEEMRQLIRRRKIPQEHIAAIIDGVLRDTSDAPFETFEDVRQYCYGVASAVGLASIFIFGFSNPRTKEFAESLGYALQFTNILRDVVDDMRSHNRVYIPNEELKAFGVTREDLRDPEKNPACKKLFEMMYFRAKHFFNKSRRLLCQEDKKNLAPALIMWAIYEEILERLRKLDFAIPAKPLKISKLKKISLAFGAIGESKRNGEKKAFGKVAVIGGGVAGAAAALKLCAEGFDVSLYESRPTLGGRAAAIQWEGAMLDNATHALMGCYKNFFGFVNKLGCGSEEFFAPATAMDFISKSSCEKVEFAPKNSSGIKKFFGFLRYMKLPAMKSVKNAWLLLKIKFSFAKAKENENAKDYLARMKIPQSAVETFWSPFCVSALNTPIETASAAVMRATLQKSILKSAEDGRLYFPKKPIAAAMYPRVSDFIRACGGKVFLGDAVEKIEFEKGKANALVARKSGREKFDYIVVATNPNSCAELLKGDIKSKIIFSALKENPIENVYFTTRKKLFNSDYACLVGSKLHWIFDHTQKMKDAPKDKYLYAITISANSIKESVAETEKFVHTELTELFGEFEMENFLPMTFAGATLSADCATERARPNSDAAQISNLKIIGDWTATDLPATLESAAKSAADLQL